MPLTAEQVIRELKDQAQIYRNSYQEKDGVVRDKYALRTLGALRVAIRLVRLSARKRGRKQ